jgi:hypothetical protein
MKLKWGILSQKKMRVKLIGGVIREAFEAVRIPGDPDLKKKICTWVLRYHNT